MNIQLLDPAAAKDFVNSSLWMDLRRCVMARRPTKPDPTDPSHVAAARGHQRAGFEAAIEAIEALPFEVDETPVDPFSRPAVAITED